MRIAGLALMVLSACASAPPAKNVLPKAITAAAPARPVTTSELPIHADDAILGDPRAPVTVILLGDATDPRFPDYWLGARLAQRRSPHEVRVVWKDRPSVFRPVARLAARAGRVIHDRKGSAAFFEYVDALARHPNVMAEADIRAEAARFGASAEEIAKPWPAFDEKLLRDRDEMLDFQSTGTDVLVDGERVDLAFSPTALLAVVDEHRGEAALMGGDPDFIYDALVRPHVEKAPAGSLAPATEYVPILHSPARGPANALLTVVLFGDLEAGHTRWLYAVLRELEPDYGNDLRIVWKHPSNGESLGMGEPRAGGKIEWFKSTDTMTLLEDVRARLGDGAFFAMIDRVCATDLPLRFDALARAGALDPAAARTLIGTKKHRARIREDANLGGDLGVSVPDLFINGRRFPIYAPVEDLKLALNTELARAKGRVSSGTPREKVYEELIEPARIMPEDVVVPAYAPRLGAASPKLTMHVFLDLADEESQSAFLSGSSDLYSQLLEIPGVQIIPRFIVSTGQSQSVAIVLLEAYKQKGQHGFLTFARGLLEGNTTAPAIAKKAGVDWARVEKAIADHRWREALVSERDAAKRLGITRPTALLGTRRLRHVWAYPLQEALEDALENGP